MHLPVAVCGTNASAAHLQRSLLQLVGGGVSLHVVQHVAADGHAAGLALHPRVGQQLLRTSSLARILLLYRAAASQQLQRMLISSCSGLVVR
jgi:hypothetical protein